MFSARNVEYAIITAICVVSFCLGAMVARDFTKTLNDDNITTMEQLSDRKN